MTALQLIASPLCPSGRAAFTIAETAMLIAVSERQVRTLIDQGRLVAFSIGDSGRHRRVPAWSIDKFTRGGDDE